MPIATVGCDNDIGLTGGFGSDGSKLSPLHLEAL
jgi:hypothetical protein